MAYTDALSVACKSLGMGADVYWGDSKYQNQDKDEITTKEQAEKYVINFGQHKGKTIKEIVENQKDYANWLYKNGDDTIKKCLNLMLGE